MNNRTKDSQNDVPAWLTLEKDVAKLLALFGYDEVVHDIKIDAGQCDVIARSSKRNKASLVVECKYHQNKSSKVNNTEVRNFVNKVKDYRHDGVIDKGYLITNTGFTVDAKSTINSRTENYVHLMTYDELVESLLDVDRYLNDFIKIYEGDDEGSRYVEMRLINTTDLQQTLLDSFPGDVVSDKDLNQSYLIVPESMIGEEFKFLPFLNFSKSSYCPTVETIPFLKSIKEYKSQQKAMLHSYQTDLGSIFYQAVEKVATVNKIDLLKEIYWSLTPDTIATLSWSVEAVTDLLLKEWQSDGGDFRLKDFEKEIFRKRIRRSIIQQFRILRDNIKEEPLILPALISNYWRNIFDALQLETGTLTACTDVEKETPWGMIEEIDNILNHIDQRGLQTAPLKLLIENDALNSLEQFIDSDTASVLVLIGDYGAGKTTILRTLMHRLASKKLRHPNDPAYRTPLLISLKEYNDAPDMNGFIKAFLQDTVDVDNVSVRTFKELNEEGRFILLLDAFDEMLMRVTKARRRRCFTEIAQMVAKNAKIILTGRPAYFNDYTEFVENLNLLRKSYMEDGRTLNSEYEVRCLQLLDEGQVEELIAKLSPLDHQTVLNILLDKPNLMDLARRPVLASMIAQTGKDLMKLENNKATARAIYEIYTDKWIKREEDKGEFRLLIHPQEKSTFVRYLAMQMYLSGSVLVRFDEIDKAVTAYFKLDSMEKIDHFSNDIRTCSFLSRTDDGYYFFIHKSFIEFFVACEFEQMERSPFAAKFSGELNIEIIDLLNLDLLPVIMRDLWRFKDNLEVLVGVIKKLKETVVKSQLYEEASKLREIEKALLEIWDRYGMVISMNLHHSINLKADLEGQVKNLFTYCRRRPEWIKIIEDNTAQEYLKFLSIMS